VGRTLQLSLADLLEGFQQTTVIATMQCAGNRRASLLSVRDIPGEDPWGGGATGTGKWTGVRLADVLAAAGVGDGAHHVAFSAHDVSRLPRPAQPYGSSIPIQKAMAGEVLLAWAMNDADLTAVHGAPVRVVVPGYIGARSVKWIDRITVQTEPSDNYFQATAYRILPPDVDPAKACPGDGISLSSVALNCEILRPVHGEQIHPGPVRISGYAFAGDDRSIERVDISTDAGQTWHQAELDEQASPWAWRLWHTTVNLNPGRVNVRARAWDSTGATQPQSPEHVWNPKGYANNSWASRAFDQLDHDAPIAKGDAGLKCR
jgi:sulfite oxidase